jgi:hypothetical protein
MIPSTLAIVTCVGGMSAQNADAEPPKIAYAHVLGDGTLDIANSKNVMEIGGGTVYIASSSLLNPKTPSPRSPVTPPPQTKV